MRIYDNQVEAIKVCISFVSIFATIGGAYLGAKVSGKNAIEQYKLDQTSKSNKEVMKLLIEIKGTCKKLREINKENILIISSIQNGGERVDFVTYEGNYKNWEYIYDRLKIEIISTTINFDDIKNLQEPTMLLPYLEVNTDYVFEEGKGELINPQGTDFNTAIKSANVYLTQEVPNNIEKIETMIEENLKKV
ncbi:hypothetical protein [Staphylococcus equorum]|uniref:hypothetical protein n=1 Tax=Staphylococcus equorum TaxID=246432 RepID=UPI003EB80854